MAGERAVIVGGGIAGLATALALESSGRELIILERDPEPPEIAPQDAFELWARPGVPQFRHAHIFLGRLQTLLRDRYPALHAELLQAGLEPAKLTELLPVGLRDRVQPMPGDDDLLHFWGRRATFEYVLRRHVARLPHVRFIHDVRVVGFVTEATAEQLRVRGVEYTREGSAAREVIEADLVVDASGKRSKSPEWLAAKGVAIEVENKPSGFVYACRHYKLRDPSAEPPRLDGGGNLDYLGYSTFYAEHGHYALTFGCPVDEAELADALCSAEGFEALCEQFPVLKRRTALSEVRSKVLGAGRFENRWTRYGTRGGLRLLGFFAVGDSQFETNPMYGRGCAAAFIQAEVLAEVLGATSDALERARRYPARCHELLQPYYELSVNTDHIYHVRAKLHRGAPIPLRDRILNFLYETAFLPASHGDPVVAREFLRAVQMREISSVGQRLVVALRVAATLFRSLLGLGTRAVLPAPPPERREFLRCLPAPRTAEHAAVTDPP